MKFSISLMSLVVVLMQKFIITPFNLLLRDGCPQLHGRSVCEDMINSGSLPDKGKIGEIMNFFCEANKAKEAHLVYLTAEEKNLSPPRSSVDVLIRRLALNDETVSLALELLGNYPINSFKPATKTFPAIVNGMCKVKKSEEVKKIAIENS
ncbi:uncharacterized protein A4U43_C04F18750 [Asparagus officinalis]|uniref:Uncharacterized protein n=1 Tax=Asparagus officinalis TaxID=4686 RepID=A0A5P1F2I3_ASPOF|nr:uncharacterized protein A4U43_C04F18750 [Asparagus officinalis]